MTSTTPKPDTGPVLLDDDYRHFIWRIMERLEREQAKTWELQHRVVELKSKVEQLESQLRLTRQGMVKLVNR